MRQANCATQVRRLKADATAGYVRQLSCDDAHPVTFGIARQCGDRNSLAGIAASTAPGETIGNINGVSAAVVDGICPLCGPPPPADTARIAARTARIIVSPHAPVKRARGTALGEHTSLQRCVRCAPHA
jgi:hypothetical protein